MHCFCMPRPHINVWVSWSRILRLQVGIPFIIKLFCGRKLRPQSIPFYFCELKHKEVVANCDNLIKVVTLCNHLLGLVAICDRFLYGIFQIVKRLAVKQWWRGVGIKKPRPSQEGARPNRIIKMMYFCIVKSILHWKCWWESCILLVVVRVIHHESGQFKINNSSVTKRTSMPKYGVGVSFCCL